MFTVSAVKLHRDIAIVIDTRVEQRAVEVDIF
jgi:hypothetical protein